MSAINRPILNVQNDQTNLLQTEKRIMVVDDEVFNTVAIKGLMGVLGFN